MGGVNSVPSCTERPGKKARIVGGEVSNEQGTPQLSPETDETTGSTGADDHPQMDAITDHKASVAKSVETSAAQAKKSLHAAQSNKITFGTDDRRESLDIDADRKISIAASLQKMMKHKMSWYPPQLEKMSTFKSIFGHGSDDPEPEPAPEPTAEPEPESAKKTCFTRCCESKKTPIAQADQ